MGWGSGSELAAQIWDKVEPLIPEDKRPGLAANICMDFMNEDCDTLHETGNLWSYALKDIDFLVGELTYHYDDIKQDNLDEIIQEFTSQFGHKPITFREYDLKKIWEIISDKQ